MAPLPNGLPTGNRLAKDFDLLCTKVQLALLKQTPDFVCLRDKIRDLMSQLEEKRDIPMVKEQLQLIEQVESESWWTDVTPELIDKACRKLRDLYRKKVEAYIRANKNHVAIVKSFNQTVDADFDVA